jgi:hypothetical protein
MSKQQWHHVQCPTNGKLVAAAGSLLWMAEPGVDSAYDFFRKPAIRWHCL